MSSNSSVNGGYEASISPPVFITQTSNGNYTSPFFEAAAQNGVGPFEYEWSFEGGNSSEVEINSPTKKRTNMNVSSSNSFVKIKLKCKIKDTGNGNATKEATAEVAIEFGINPQ